MTSCDSCGVSVSSGGYLGGTVWCHECARAKRKGEQDTLQARREKYGGGE